MMVPLAEYGRRFTALSSLTGGGYPRSSRQLSGIGFVDCSYSGRDRDMVSTVGGPSSALECGVADSLCLRWPQFAMRSAIAIAVPDPLKHFAPNGERQAESPRVAEEPGADHPPADAGLVVNAPWRYRGARGRESRCRPTPADWGRRRASTRFGCAHWCVRSIRPYPFSWWPALAYHVPRVGGAGPKHKAG